MIACADLPSFPLQIVWREEPALRELPLVIVDEDRPQGVILWACERARASKILPGMRYAHALSLVSSLRARVLAQERIDAAVAEIAAKLRAFSPDVEPALTPGTFWLDGAGLERVWTGDGGGGWAAAISGAITAGGYQGTVVVGFTRFGTYALAKAARQRIAVLASDEDERATARAVPLARLDIDPKLRDALARLAVKTVGELVRLPGGGVLERFGSEAYRLYQLAAGERWDPLVPEPPPDAPDERTLLDDPERDVERLVFAVKSALDRLLARLAVKRRALTVLHLELTVQHGVRANAVVAERIAHAIRPAQATLDARALLRLVHLRLEGAPPPVGVIAVRVWADDIAATREQLSLFASRPRRDLRAADEAIARLRAELGDDAVVKAVVRDAHLPEARFGWERLEHVIAARVRDREPSLVRKIYTKPVLVAQQSPSLRDDGWLLGSLAHGAVVRMHGPYVVSGGWWAGGEVQREYHFAETRRGECLWVYFDRSRRKWFQQGVVD
ncbi:MAG TPA: hypothetical protein VL463_31295 [Kofleriaceae bacterium]|nr:hypothetical protein [Kofleriaceae bacterium]